ncbi:helix-turn-helix domain-containing protein [Salinimicrobium xinjiangense]|uniref:helix-turn-helix domain-containing protein n=1 Tax=Salinimicrobium xinjiangense TaxID=438596 RepID=UPI000401DF99|nr:transcriptional regulator [Salinimicrobium xinjiangense]
MNIRPIKTENDYNFALSRIEKLWGAQRDTPEGDEFDLLVAPPDPIDAIKFRMEQMGMTNADMVKYLGSQSRVSEILNRKRNLTLGMIKTLYKELKIPAEILLA